MKKLVSVFLVFCMLVPCLALGEDAQANGTITSAPATVTANGIVRSVDKYDIVAPYSGIVAPFTWAYGDAVNSGDTLFTLDTNKLYAPADGTLQAVFVEEGELAEDVVSRYGMIAAIESNPPLIAKASTGDAYDDPDTKVTHMGETVYFYETKDKDNEGEGRIIATNGKEYTVEITAGDFEAEDGVKFFRDEKMGTKTCLGTGTVERSADIAVIASGRVLDCVVTPGQRIKTGQLLFELASSDASPDITSNKITASHDGAIGSLQVVSGQQVYKGQVLATIYGLTELKVVAEVDEVDLDLVQIGDSLTVMLDRYPDQKVVGTVAEISRIGVQKQNATYYDVEIAITTSLEVLPGMNGTIWLTQAQ